MPVAAAFKHDILTIYVSLMALLSSRTFNETQVTRVSMLLLIYMPLNIFYIPDVLAHVHHVQPYSCAQPNWHTHVTSLLAIR